MPWDDDLSPDSQAYGIAASESRRLRVVAGPGTGKSFALKRRVARLLENDVAADTILPVTFTRVAAEDLHRELVSLNVDGADTLKGRTLHSLGLSILRRNNVLESTGRTPRPLNQYEMEPFLYDLPGTFGHKPERKRRIRAYEAAWARLQHEEPGFAQDDVDAEFERVLVEWLMFHDAMLIGEIIPELYRYLRDNPAAPERRMFRHILVDEFQDLNKAEQRVLELLGEEDSLCVVGDDDQSIYSFKFANPEGIRNWHEVHVGTDDHELLECRRCPLRVVQIANSVIGHNQDREARQLREVPENRDGDVHIHQYTWLEDEANGISNIVVDLIENQGVPPGDILILAQRRVIGTPIFENLSEVDVPVKSYYQESELDNEMAQERLSLLKLLVDRDDKVALRWLLGRGSNDFRWSAYRRVRQRCEATGLSPWSVVSSLASGGIRILHTNRLVGRFRDIEDELTRLDQIAEMDQFIEA